MPINRSHSYHQFSAMQTTSRRLAIAQVRANADTVEHVHLCRGPVVGPDHPNAKTFSCHGMRHPKPETEVVDIGGKEGAAARWYRAGHSLEEGETTWVKTEDCPVPFWVSKNYCYVKAAELDPNFAKAYYRLGTVLHAANESSLSTKIIKVGGEDLSEIDCFDKAVQLDFKFIEKSKRFCTDKAKVKAWNIIKDAHIKRRVDALEMEIDNLPEIDPRRAELRSAHWDMVLSLLSRDVYFSNEASESAGLIPQGWGRVTDPAGLERAGLTPELLSNNITGYFGVLYQNKNSDTYVYANRGTVAVVDGATNLLQGVGLGMLTPYDHARNIARHIAQSKIAGKVTFTGHSMGGGLAAAQSVAANRKGVTFNAAGLHVNTPDGEEELKTFNELSHSGLVRAYHVNCETLNGLQDSPIVRTVMFAVRVAGAVFFRVDTAPGPPAVGIKVELDAVKDPVMMRDGTLMPGDDYTAEEAKASGLDLHSMTKVVNSMFKHFVDKCNDPDSGLTVNA